MTSFELLSRIEAILHSMLSVTVLRETLISMANKYSSIQSLLNDLSAAPSNNIGPFGLKLQETLQTFSESYRKLRPMALIREISILESAISELRVLTNKDEPGSHGNVGVRLSNFSTAYENFVMSYSLPATLVLLIKAGDLFTALQTTVEMLEGMVRNLEKQERNGDSEGYLSILLHPTDELSVFTSKLEALNIIYEELCRLLNVSTSEHPLTVVKVESGSLWAKIFGESQVVKLMTDLIRSGLSYIHRSYTQEGKLATIPRQVEELESVLNLETRMRQLGYDTDDMRESNRKSGAVIAKELNRLLAGEAVVVINEQTFSVGSAVDRLLLERSNTRLLKESNSAENFPLNEDSSDSANEL